MEHHAENPDVLAEEVKDHQIKMEHPDHNPDLETSEDQALQALLEHWLQEVSPSERLKCAIIDHQKNWLADYMSAREKWLTDITEKLHEEFLAEEEKTKHELCQQFKAELETIKQELEKKFENDLSSQITMMEELHRKNLRLVRKAQWCWECEKEAIYPCCWNTAYCSLECQKAHWPSHKLSCQRKKPDAAEQNEQ